VVALSRLRHIGLILRPDGKQQTASIGIAERIQDKTPNQNALVELADHRMYLAKKKQGNQIVHEDEDNVRTRPEAPAG
jgi:GGDEF domain-containing protein